MKKKLESELMSIAHKILKLKGKEDVNKMHAEVAALYEKLTVLKFAQENFEDDLPTIGNDSSFFGMLDTAFNNTVSDNIEVDNKTYVNLDEREEEDIMEPVMEKIKDMVAQMPQETQEVDAIFEQVNADSKPYKNDFEEITANYSETPVFEKANDIKAENEKKSLNDKLKSGGINIGLNDKLAFIKHLFDGKSEDYDRVISQLNTIESFDAADHFIKTKVKPDYNFWLQKEEYSERLMEIIESKFN
ncbi:hypothetical protein [uncultured Lacinutrix sp.]|uniref:hypothetical protein n=1 Tax=uncultured Lacinutrix sp. TaxID=574032 RepID=UPI0026212C41|nr:hypothetical protein [uncultured Lacinutrix sp.]